MKNRIVAILTLVIIGLMALTASRGGAYHGGELGKVIKDIDRGAAAKTTQDSVPAQNVKQEREEDEKLKALKDKAGSMGDIKVSDAYKSKCSACHGVDGSGMQDGRKLMGPKLYGQAADKLYKDLTDFKSGRKENLIMKGLLMNINEEELRKLADEIGSFSSQKSK